MRWVTTLAMGFSLGAISVQPAAAQSTIFNIPTTDTVSPGKGYFEFDYLPQLPAPDAGQFQIVVPHIGAGVTRQLALGGNVATTHDDEGGRNYPVFQPNAKHKFLADDSKGL